MISSMELLILLKAEGWVRMSSEASHFQLAHPDKPDKLTLPHPVKEFSITVINRLQQQSGLKLNN